MPRSCRKTDLNCIQFLSLYVSDFFSGSYPISIWKKCDEIFAEFQFVKITKSFKTFFAIFLLINHRNSITAQAI
jgi:hypothetical protein